MPNLPGGWELILIVILIMVLFGYKRLPEATRSIGKSMRIFKAETKGLRDDDATAGTTGTGTTANVIEPAPVRHDATTQPVDPDAVRIIPPDQTGQRPL